MGDHHTGTGAPDALQRLLEEHFSGAINAGCGLVERQHPLRAERQRPRQRQQLR